MSRINCLSTFMIGFSLFFTQTYAQETKSLRNKVIFLVIDGFRYDYVDMQPPQSLPGFSQLLEEGIRADYMNPVFPSLSYPSWTTLVTGLYPESHGIVGNYMYDSKDGTFFTSDDGSQSDPKWWNKAAEPIWIASTKSGIKTANIFFSKCEIPYDNIVPEFCQSHTTEYGIEFFMNNINMALDKLQEDFDFILVHTGNIDHAGHDYGPESDEVLDAVRKTDEVVQYLLRRIDELDMTERVNIVIVSDHGMMDTRMGRIDRIELDDYLRTDDVEAIVDHVSCTMIKLKEGRTRLDEVYNQLSEMPGVDVYKHEDIPENLHYKNNERIYDILIKANPDTFILASSSPVMMPPRNDDYIDNGSHGWFAEEVDQMRGIFFAKGPDFKVNKTIPGIQSVDIYPLISHILKLKENPNNGTFDRVRAALSETIYPVSDNSVNDSKFENTHVNTNSKNKINVHTDLISTLTYNITDDSNDENMNSSTISIPDMLDLSVKPDSPSDDSSGQWIGMNENPVLNLKNPDRSSSFQEFDRFSIKNITEQNLNDSNSFDEENMSNLSASLPQEQMDDLTKNISESIIFHPNERTTENTVGNLFNTVTRDETNNGILNVNMVATTSTDTSSFIVTAMTEDMDIDFDVHADNSDAGGTQSNGQYYNIDPPNLKHQNENLDLTSPGGNQRNEYATVADSPSESVAQSVSHFPIAMFVFNIMGSYVISWFCTNNI